MRTKKEVLTSNIQTLIYPPIYHFKLSYIYELLTSNRIYTYITHISEVYKEMENTHTLPNSGITRTATEISIMFHNNKLSTRIFEVNHENTM